MAVIAGVLGFCGAVAIVPLANAEGVGETAVGGKSDLDAVLERLRRVEENLEETRAALRAAEERERERDDRLTATEDELEAAQQQVDRQVEVLEDHGLAEPAEDSFRSRVGDFFARIDFSGWVAGSYNYNFARNGNQAQVGQNSFLLYPNSNSFQLDQAWLVIDEAATESSRAGFHVDFYVGQHARFLDSMSGSDEFALYTAYVSYLAPLFEGVRIDIGRLAAGTGYETIEAWRNTHISRGLTWQFQPITNTGIRLSADLPHGFSAVVGVVNDAYSRSLAGATNNPDIDFNAFKTLNFGLGWSGDQVSIAATGYFGREAALEPDANTPSHSGLVDLLILVDPHERLSLFLNSNAFLHPDVVDVGRFVSASAGGRFAVMEDLGLALRGEWARTEGPNFALDDDVDVWSVTATTDYAFTHNLIGKLELRYDRADDAAFFDSGGREDTNADYDQLAIFVQALLGF